MSSCAPIACTLDAARLPGRLGEFRALFATTRSVDRISPQHLRVTLAGDSALEATARDLLAREQQCCSFFDFALTNDGEGALTLDVRVPAGAVEIVDEFARVAGDAAGLPA